MLSMVRKDLKFNKGKNMNANNNSLTPEIIYEGLKRWGKLIHMYSNYKDNIVVKYYSMDTGVPLCKSLRGKAFKVILYGGKAVQIIKTTEEEAETMASCSKLDFGGF